MNYAQLIKHYGQLLEACGEEVENFIYVLKDLKQWSTTDYLLNQNSSVSDTDQQLMENIFQQLKNIDHRSILQVKLTLETLFSLLMNEF